MADPRIHMRRADPRSRTRQDVERYERREPGNRFWRSMALIGSVGWPIVLLSVGGAIAGQYLDGRWDTGIRFTLILLTLGTIAGSAIAFRTVHKDRP